MVNSNWERNAVPLHDRKRMITLGTAEVVSEIWHMLPKVSTAGSQTEDSMVKATFVKAMFKPSSQTEATKMAAQNISEVSRGWIRQHVAVGQFEWARTLTFPFTPGIHSHYEVWLKKTHLSLYKLLSNPCTNSLLPLSKRNLFWQQSAPSAFDKPDTSSSALWLHSLHYALLSTGRGWMCWGGRGRKEGGLFWSTATVTCNITCKKKCPDMKNTVSRKELQNIA